MDLLSHLAIFRANWWRILVAAAIVGGASYTFSQSHPKVFAADQLMTVASQDPSTGRGETQIALRVQFYAAVGNSRLVASAVRSKQHLTDLAVDQVQSHIFVFETASSGILEVTATGRTPVEAATIAGGVSAALSDFVTKEQTDATNTERSALEAQVRVLQTTLNTAAARNDPNLTGFVQQEITKLRRTLLTLQVSSFQVTPLTPPVIRPGPISPHPKKAGMLGFLVTAILVGEGAVLTRGFKDRFARTNDVEQVTNLTGLPVLAMVPHGRGPDVVESFRTLRTNLMFLEGAERPRTVALVSPNPGAGKSFCAMHLAESAVAVDGIVVLLDADLRRPVLHSRLRCDREPGLSNALRGSALASTLQPVPGIPNLKLVASGSAVNDAVGVLGGRAFRHVLDELVFADVVIVDTPPGAVYADALAVAAQCDATLLVLDANSTRRRAARTFIDSLERTGATVIGVVMNNAPVDVHNTYEGQFRGRLRIR